MISISIVMVLSVLCAFFLVLEGRGLPTTLTLTFKGDLKRETRFLAQYGQLLCTFFTSVLIWQIDKARGLRICEALWSSVIGATLIATLVKRLVGRGRPRTARAGKFQGPSWKSDNHRESFPSSHSASAVAYAAILASAYPSAAVTFWILALICATLRYLMDAHWPSDVLGGISLGYAAGIVAWKIFF